MVFKRLTMTTYPFDASNFENNKIRVFRNKEGHITNIVGKVDEFKTKESFLNWLVENKIAINNDIQEAYIRYYSILPKTAVSVDYTYENEGYTFCKAGRGASKVYVLKIKDGVNF